jgi:predicted metal-dependent peptidase
MQRTILAALRQGNALLQVLDEHMDGDEQSDGDSEGEDGDKKGTGRPRLSDEEKRQIKDEIREALLQAAQAVGTGNLPGGVKRLIKDLTKPVVNWRELLQQQIQSTVKDDFSWMRPNRRGWHMDAVMPGMKPGTQIDVCVAIDTSGSISEKDLKDFLSEVKGIMESYDEYKIRVITWDTSVYNPEEFTSDNMSDITSYTPGGGGGTDPHCVWEWLKDNDIEPKKLIMFTDFCFFGWDPASVQDYCDTVWVIKGNPDAEPEFGVWAHYEEAKKHARA